MHRMSALCGVGLDPERAQPHASAGSSIGAQRFVVLSATQSGNAALVADLVAERLRALGAASVVVLPEGEAPVAEIREADVLVACVASHGEGDVPDGFLEAYEALARERPSLRGLRYGLIGLGDRTYSTFCGGAWKVDQLLRGIGAERVGEVCTIDASTQPFPDEDALAWLGPWTAQL